MYHELAAPPVPVGIHENRRLVGVPVVFVVRRVLEVPDELAVIGAQGQQRRGVEIVAFAVATIEVLRAGIAGRPVQQVEFRVVGAAGPGSAAAGLPRVVVRPRLRPGLARSGDRVEAPLALPGFGVEGVEVASDATGVAAADADQHPILCDDGRAGRAEAGLVRGHGGAPQHRPVAAVDRDYVAVRRAEIQASPRQAEASAPVGVRAPVPLVEGVVEAPHGTAGGRVQGERPHPARSQIHHAVPDERRRLAAQLLRAVLEHPLGNQPGDVVAIDASELGVATAGVVAVVAEPVGWVPVSLL